MKILYATSEALPFIASGGLADVAGSLPAALNRAGEDCRVVLPLYQGIKEELRQNLEYICNFTVDVSWRKQYCGVFKNTISSAPASMDISTMQSGLRFSHARCSS